MTTFAPPQTHNEAAAERYLDLLKKVLTRSIAPERYRRIPRSQLRRNRLAWLLWPMIDRLLDPFGLALCRAKFDPVRRANGRDWPAEAETMVGLARLDNVHTCIRSVLERGIPGDFAETGVWRGGVGIFMRAALDAYGDPGRCVWMADSFAGLPEPDPRYEADRDSEFHEFADFLAVPLEQVRANFAKYGLLDDRVRFLPGWFRDTLPHAPIERLAILRLDGDMYSSTMDAITSLYPKLSPGGYVIVDDYHTVPACRQAIDDYRERQGIDTVILPIDSDGVYWEKSR